MEKIAHTRNVVSFTDASNFSSLEEKLGQCSENFVAISKNIFTSFGIKLVHLIRSRKKRVWLDIENQIEFEEALQLVTLCVDSGVDYMNVPIFEDPSSLNELNKCCRQSDTRLLIDLRNDSLAQQTNYRLELIQKYRLAGLVTNLPFDPVDPELFCGLLIFAAEDKESESTRFKTPLSH